MCAAFVETGIVECNFLIKDEKGVAAKERQAKDGFNPPLAGEALMEGISGRARRGIVRETGDQ